jgi:glycerol-3-phosphate acyltransferase PlsX
MGGDKGPQVVAQGFFSAASATEAHYLLFGDPKILDAELARVKSRLPNVEVVAARQIIEMTEQPVEAFRKKPDASVIVAAQLVRDGKADGLVTIANTGAAVAVSLLTLRRIKGIDRPAIATPLPSITGTVVLLDAGATPDCDSNNLFEFAIMGSTYAQSVVGVGRPRVGLLSIGEEDTKGNALVKRANILFRDAAGVDCPFEFIGNVEGRDIFRGNVDVVVCDGFVGNTLLKTSEGVAEMMQRLIREELNRHIWMKPLLIPFRPAFQRLRKRMDYAERGGAPLLGVNGVCIIGHGRSDAFAVMNACRAAERAIKHDLVNVITERVCASTPPPPPM